MWSVTSAIIYSTEHKTPRTRKRMYVPASVCSRARSWTGRGGKAREGRTGSRKEECHRFTKSGKVTQPLSVPYLSQNCLSAAGHMVVYQCSLAAGALLRGHLLRYSGIKSHNPYDELPVVSSQCLSSAFPDVCREGLNLVPDTILRGTLLEHLPAGTGSRQNDSPRRPSSFPHTHHCPWSVSVCSTDLTQKGCENQQDAFSTDCRKQARMSCCAINSKLCFLICCSGLLEWPCPTRSVEEHSAWLETAESARSLTPVSVTTVSGEVVLQGTTRLVSCR